MVFFFTSCYFFYQSLVDSHDVNVHIIISSPNEVGGGGGGGGGGEYTGFTLSVRPSVRLSVDDMVSGA